MSSRQYSRFLFFPPEYSCEADVAATQLLPLPNGFEWLTFHSWVKKSGQTSSSISDDPLSSALAR